MTSVVRPVRPEPAAAPRQPAAVVRQQQLVDVFRDFLTPLARVSGGTMSYEQMKEGVRL
jgi:hypothetical protein